ncbi:DUF4160 domain-containing protein [Azospirillum sp.]|uniref:DUF4160 domain-containing protein n=1 Tax=Azospirillum sp. TaxID=34012 RepID=UPI003D7152A4
MPTVHRQDGFRFYFYSHEPNEPAHVHVDRGGASAKVWLTPVQVAVNMGYSAHELAEVLRIVRGRRETLLEEWHGFFGTQG